LVKVGDYEVAEGLYYHKEHLWTRIEDGKAKIARARARAKCAQFKKIILKLKF